MQDFNISDMSKLLTRMSSVQENEGQVQNGEKTEKSTETNEVKKANTLNVMMEMFSEIFTPETGNNKNVKSTDPTNLGNVLDSPIGGENGNEPKIDYAKILGLLQMLCTETQLKLSQDRIKQINDSIAARCKQALDNVQASIEKWQKAEKDRKAALITAWATLAAATAALAAAVVCNVLSCGLGTAAVVAAGIAVAAAAATVAMLEKPTLMAKLVNLLGDLIRDVAKVCGHDISRRDAKKAAEIFMLAVVIAITVASMVASLTSNPTNTAMCIGRLVQLGATIAQGAMGLASAGIGIASTIHNYEAAKLQIELKQIQQFLLKLQQRLKDEQETVQEIMKLLMNCVTCIMDSLQSQDSVENQIITELSQNFA